MEQTSQNQAPVLGALKPIVEMLRTPQKVLVTSHTNPDGDAVGSTLGMGLILRAMGHEVTFFNGDPIPNLYEFLPGAGEWQLKLSPEKRFDTTIILDVYDLPRTGLVSYPKEVLGKLVVIDHHVVPPGGRHAGEIFFIDPAAAASAVLVYRFAQLAGVKITRDIALNIYAGVLTDTGSFHYASATPEAFRIAGEMVACGVSPWEFSKEVFESHPLERMVLLAEVLKTLDIDSSGTFASIYVTDDSFKKYHANPEVTDGFINFPRSIKGVEVAIFFRQNGPDTFKVSFRSSGNVDVRSVCTRFGGGGHRNAAGCTMQGELSNIKTQVYQACREEISRAALARKA